MQALVLIVALLAPERLYYQPNQPVPIKLEAAALKQAEYKDFAKLLLLDPDGKKLAEAAFDPARITGTFDLAALMPAIWTGGTCYLQPADKAGKPIGAPLVIVPLTDPAPQFVAVQTTEDGQPVYLGQARPRPAKPEKIHGLRIYVEKRAILTTTEGDITLAFSPEHAPNHVTNFMHLVDGGFYTNVPFHRVLPGFVIQGGDPTGTGEGGPGYWVQRESNPKLHHPGTLSMARSGYPDSAGSQFFICLERKTHLDKGYTAFGDVVEGMEAVKKIGATPLSDPKAGSPVKAPILKSAKLVLATPRTLAK